MAAISYMKDYTLQHFKDEEDYQKSIGYSGYAEHREIHQKFVQTVLNHERKMIMSDFDERHIKDFMGTLIAWLVYHVAGTDQQIKAKKSRDTTLYKRRSSIDRYFNASTRDTLGKLIGRDIINTNIAKLAINDLQSVIVIKIHLGGDTLGKITFKYTKQLAFELIKNMTAFTPENIDGMVCSAMLEISNIISAKAIAMMKYHGLSHHNIKTPVIQVHPAFLTSDSGIIFDTGMGILEMTVSTA